MRGKLFPVADGAGTHEQLICEWDSHMPNYGMHLRSIKRDDWLATAYEPSTGGRPNGLEKVELIQQLFGDAINQPGGVQYEGTEGALYNLHSDPLHPHNL